MFYVVNKEKIIAYTVTIFTVAVLYFVANTYSKNTVIPTANMLSNTQVENITLLPKDT